MNIWKAQIGFCGLLKKDKKRKRGHKVGRWIWDESRGKKGGYGKNAKHEIFNKISCLKRIYLNNYNNPTIANTLVASSKFIFLGNCS